MKIDSITQKQLIISLASAVIILMMIAIVQSYQLQVLINDSKHLMEDSISGQITVIDQTWKCNDFQDYKKMLDEMPVTDPHYISSTLDQHIIQEGKDKGCL